MKIRAVWLSLSSLVLCALIVPALAQGSPQTQTSASSSSKSKKTPKAPVTESVLDAGGVFGAFYRNKPLGLSCKIPPGWVLRTEEMNAHEEAATGEQNAGAETTKSVSEGASKTSRAAVDRTAEGGCPHICNRVLLAAFSRPPEAKGEDVNGSILIAAESVSTYPGLTEAVQYLGPLEEVAKAQGFVADEDPYEIAIGTKTLVREDFHKDVGSRVMRQSTLVFLAKGYAVSITVIGGTEDEVEELVDGVGFGGK